MSSCSFSASTVDSAEGASTLAPLGEAAPTERAPRRLRVALVGPTHPFRGGISHYTTLLAHTLRQRHEVQLFGFSRQYPAWLYPGVTDRDEGSAAVLQVAHDPVLDGVNPWTWWRVARTLRRTRPDLLIVQWTVPFWIPLLWLLLRLAPAGTRRVLICHNAAPHEEGRWTAGLRRWAQAQVMGLADLLLCHAESDERLLRALLPQSTIARVMLPSYAGLAQVAPPPTEHSARRGQPHLLFFGLVRPYKGVSFLLEAMPRILAALPEARLTVAGEWWAAAGDPATAIPAAARHAVEIRNRYIPNEEMAALFHTADVVVLPYRSATQSAVVQLAYGFGVPVITTAVGGLPEAVQHEQSGLVVPPDDADALAEAIIRYHREGWRERLAPGVAAARARFSWEALVAVLEGFGT